MSERAKGTESWNFGCISGLCQEVETICEEIGLVPHTIEYSLDIQGKTERLPEDAVLEITTMCGHALVSPHLVEEMVDQINRGKRTYAEAARELSRICDCGIFNPHRAESCQENDFNLNGRTTLCPTMLEAYFGQRPYKLPGP